MEKTQAGYRAASMPFSTFSPTIDADACLLALSAASRCDACAQACPTGAFLPDDNGLNFNQEACSGCGLCVPACPEGAIAPFFKPRLMEYAGYRTVFLACSTALPDDDHDGVPCLNALGLRDMAAIRHKGADIVILSSCPADGICPAGEENRIGHAISLAKAMFESRNERFPEVRTVDIADWRDMRDKAVPCNPGRVMDRRGLLNMFTLKTNLHEDNAKAAVGAFGFTKKSPGDIVACVPDIDEERCTGCDACAQVCPHGAITYRRGDDGQAADYRLDPAECTGCRLCIDICEAEAIQLSGPGKAAPRQILLNNGQCKTCGVSFHYPQAGKENGHLCRICAKIGSTKKLFLVHEQE